MIVFGGGAFGRLLGHEGGALERGIPVLLKETSERFLVSFGHEKTQREESLAGQERSPPYFLLLPTFPTI